MKKAWQSFLGLFLKTFQFVEERKKINLIHSICKDNNGYTAIQVVPVGSNATCQFYPHQLIAEPLLKKQLRKSDIHLVEGLLIAEGDVFIDSKEYRQNKEFFVLCSKLNNEKWLLTYDQLNARKEILHRVNKRFFSENLVLNASIVNS